MTKANQTLSKFRPERVVYLNEANTGYKSKAEVILAIEKLRSKCWLCAYSEKVIPMHMSFSDVSEFAEFKKDANALGVKLTSPIIKPDDDFDLLLKDDPIIKPEPKRTAETSSGKIIVE